MGTPRWGPGPRARTAERGADTLDVVPLRRHRGGGGS
jgi:hypothetical protein